MCDDPAERSRRYCRLGLEMSRSPRHAHPSPAARPGHAGKKIQCPDCLADLGTGEVNHRCGTCERLYEDFIRLREHIYQRGTGDLLTLSQGSGVSIATIGRLIQIGYLRTGPEPPRSAGRTQGRSGLCDVCGNSSDGTSMCGGCRGRFQSNWDAWRDARALEQAAELEITAEAEALAVAGQVPVDDEFVAILEEEGVPLPPELRLGRAGSGMHAR